MQYFPQHNLLCTHTVHNQSADIFIQGFLGYKIQNFQNRQNSLRLCFMKKIGVFF